MLKHRLGIRSSLVRTMATVAAAAAMLHMAVPAVPVSAANFTVTTTADSGAGSLRDAITKANATNAIDTIKFNIAGGGNATIVLASDLPPITKPVDIDGTTQPGYTTQPIIWIDGGSSWNCLVLDSGSDGSTIKALSVGGCDSPNIGVYGSGGHTIQGNFLGTFDGLVPEPNPSIFYAAIYLENSDDNQIGGTAAGQGNLITGMEASGIDMVGSDTNLVEGNLIGVDLTGGSGMSNTHDGIHINGSANNVIGGTEPGARNVISDFTWGISIENAGATGNVVQGNYIGTNSSGLAAIPNDNSGISIGQDTTGNIIGGAEPGAGNLISGNQWAGISIYDNSLGGNIIKGNIIGADANQALPLGNGYAGIELVSSFNQIGGWLPGEGNVIGGNLTDGIVVGPYLPAVGNVIQGNFIGTDVTHTVDLGNQANGINVVDGDATLIGGHEEDAGNWILYNDEKGVLVTGGGVDIEGNRIRRNKTGVLMDASGIINENSRNCITANATYGMRNLTGVLTDAFDNWWGNASGPTNAANPTGTGELVGNNIDFDPWAELGCVELLDDRVLNGSFEVDSNGDLLPDDWTGTNLTLGAATDGQDCATGQLGSCSFRFVGSNKVKKFTQTVTTNGAAGEAVTLSLFTFEDNVPAAKNYKVTLTIYHMDGSKQTSTLNLPTGTSAAFAQHAAALVTTTEPYDEIEVVVEYAKISGTVWIDHLIVVAEQ